MPLIVKDITWRQTQSNLTIEVPLHGIHQSKVDLFTSPKYIKATFEKYFFEAFLLHEIDPKESKCTIIPSKIVFELRKGEEIVWECLEENIEKRDKVEIKQRIIKEEHERFQAMCKAKEDRKKELKQVAVGEQIALDTKKREIIEKIRNDEKKIALGDVQEWKNSVDNPPSLSNNQTCEDTEETDEEDEILIHKPKKIKENFRRYKTVQTVTHPMPLPRKSQTIEVEFSERQFPTPCRESRLEEENEWLQKQAEARRSAGFVSEDLRPEEKNPQWLKAKGDEFLKVKNYLGAISAYSFGIKISPNFVDLYIRRSEAHFGCGNFYKTVEDCSKALELMKPALSINLNARAECMFRRGMALSRFNMYREAMIEMQSALKLQPTNQNIIVELERVREELEK